MSLVTLRDGVAAGNLLFKSSISSDQLVEAAKDLRSDADGEHFLELYVRANGKKSHCICFMYFYGNGRKEYEKFFHKIRDKMFRRFGVDFKGWDMTSRIWTIS